MYIYIYIYVRKPVKPDGQGGVFITGGCSGRGVQLMGVAFYGKLVYSII